MTDGMKNWFLRQALESPKRSILIGILGTLVMAVGLRWFVIDDDMLKMLPEDIESRIAWDSVREEFGSTEVIFLAFGKEGAPVFNKENLAVLWDVSRALEDLPEVDEIFSISSMVRMDNEDGFLEVSDLQPARDLSDEEIAGIIDYLNKNPKMMKRVVSRNNDYFSIMVRPYNNVATDVFRNQVVRVAEELLPNYEVHFGGSAYLTGTIPSLIRNDVAALMRAGLLIMVVILLINLRSIPAVGMVMTVIILSLIFMMGFMGWVLFLTGSDRFLFTMLNTSMPIILLTIANSDGVHILTKFFREFRKGKNVHDSLWKTMHSLLLPVFLTSLTTIAAFLSLIFAPIEQMAGYGISMAAGIAWAWWLSSTMLPGMILLKKWDLNSKAISHASLFERAIEKFGYIVIHHPKKVLVLGSVIVGIGAIGITLLNIEVNIVTFFKPGTEIRNSIEFMDRELTGTMDLELRLEGDMKDPANLNSMLAIEDHLEKNPDVTTTISIADIIKKMHRTVMDDDPAFENIPESRGKVNNLFTLYSMSGDPDDFSSLVDYEYKTGLITALMRTVPTSEIVRFVKDINDFIDKNIDGNLSITITGMVVVFRDFVYLIIRSSFLSIFASILIITLIAAVFFRRFLWGILAVIPLISAVILNFGLMGLFGVDLSHVTVILSSIIIGVGVDFAIHYIAQFRYFSANGTATDDLSREVVHDVGYPIILDAASNMGFGALLFSAFLPIEYIGGLMVFAMISTSVATLTLLAAMVELMKKRLVRSKS
ncbi:MAG: RND family transporter [FCB group bacterium]|nr:RND family transporter [FCB group bacterium]